MNDYPDLQWRTWSKRRASWCIRCTVLLLIARFIEAFWFLLWFDKDNIEAVGALFICLLFPAVVWGSILGDGMGQAYDAFKSGDIPGARTILRNVGGAAARTQIIFYALATLVGLFTGPLGWGLLAYIVVRNVFNSCLILSLLMYLIGSYESTKDPIGQTDAEIDAILDRNS